MKVISGANSIYIYVYNIHIYIKTWIDILKSKTKLIIKASIDFHLIYFFEWKEFKDGLIQFEFYFTFLGSINQLDLGKY